MAEKDTTNQQELQKKHDQLARQALSDLKVAREFMDLYLDPEIHKLCDFDTLELISGAYVGTDLKTYYADMVFKVALKGETRRDAHIAIIAEHQSTPRKFMPLRILGYQVNELQEHVKRYKDSKPLPLVVAIVYYSGKKPYTYPTDIAELFADLAVDCKQHLGKFTLANVSQMDDDEILTHQQLAAVEMALKHIHDKDFSQATGVMFEAIMKSHENGINTILIETLISYLADGREQGEIKPLFNKMQQVSEYSEIVMSYAESLRNEGKREGIKLGKQEGIKLGEHLGEQKAQQEIARNLLKSGIDSTVVAKVTHLTKAQIEELKKSLH